MVSKLVTRRISLLLAISMLALVISTAAIPGVKAANVLVSINCVNTGCPPNVEVSPDQVVLLKSVDTISFNCNPIVPIGLGPSGANSCQVNSASLGISTGNFVGTIGPFGPFNLPAGSYKYSIDSDKGTMAPPAGKCNNCDQTISIVTSIPVGGQILPIDKAGLILPYAVLIGALIAAGAGLTIYFRRVVKGRHPTTSL
jgi:hypothetical protein